MNEASSYIVSVLFNEPKLLKFEQMTRKTFAAPGFSALQRAEIAEIVCAERCRTALRNRFSALQRAEIAEIGRVFYRPLFGIRFQCSSTSRNC